MPENKAEIKGLIQNRFGDGILFTTVDQLINWSRKNSIWFMQLASRAAPSR
jgi:NADH:ubiquinone oxidoreductase subunit B-like Fe-S oxidoreductase